MLSYAELVMRTCTSCGQPLPNLSGRNERYPRCRKCVQEGQQSRMGWTTNHRCAKCKEWLPPSSFARRQQRRGAAALCLACTNNPTEDAQTTQTGKPVPPKSPTTPLCYSNASSTASSSGGSVGHRSDPPSPEASPASAAAPPAPVSLSRSPGAAFRDCGQAAEYTSWNPCTSFVPVGLPTMNYPCVGPCWLQGGDGTQEGRSCYREEEEKCSGECGRLVSPDKLLAVGPLLVAAGVVAGDVAASLVDARVCTDCLAAALLAAAKATAFPADYINTPQASSC